MRNNLGVSLWMAGNSWALRDSYVLRVWALSEFQIATKIVPSNGLYFFNLGEAYKALGDLESAEENYQQAKKLSSNGLDERFVRNSVKDR